MKTTIVRFFVVVGMPITLFVWHSGAQQTSISGNCRSQRLPPAVITRLVSDFAGWRIQDVSDLSPSARSTWEYKKYSKPLDCPGIAVGRFESANLSYAVLMVPRDHPDSAYKLLVFSGKGSERDYQVAVLDASADPGVNDIFIHTVRLGDFFSKDSQKQLEMTADDGIIFVEAGTKQYGAEVFFRSKNGYRHEGREY